MSEDTNIPYKNANIVEIKEEHHGLPELIVKYRYMKDESKLEVYVNDKLVLTYTDEYAQIIWNKVNGMTYRNRKLLTPEIIINIAANTLGIPYENVFLKTRKKEIVFARHLAISAIERLLYPSKWSKIARIFGWMSHSTVFNSVNLMKRELKYFTMPQQRWIGAFNKNLNSYIKSDDEGEEDDS